MSDDLVCRHGGLRRTCEMCDLTVENFSLRRALADAWTDVIRLQARIAELEAEVTEDYDEGLPCACRWERAPRGVPCGTTGVRLQVCMTHQDMEIRAERAESRVAEVEQERDEARRAFAALREIGNRDAEIRIAAESRVDVLSEGIRLYRINFRHEDISDEAWEAASTDVLAWERAYGKAANREISPPEKQAHESYKKH